MIFDWRAAKAPQSTTNLGDTNLATNAADANKNHIFQNSDNIAVVVNFGGSGFRLSFVNDLSQIYTFAEVKWEHYAKAFNTPWQEHSSVTTASEMYADAISDKKLKKIIGKRMQLADHAVISVESIAQMIVTAVDDMGIDPSNIKKIGITSPGDIDSKRGAIKTTTSISLLEIEGYPFLSELQQVLSSYYDKGLNSNVKLSIFNDGEAALLGENHHPEGVFVKNNLLNMPIKVAAIGGTGFGGVIQYDRQFSGTLNELGYTLIRDDKNSTDEKPVYRFIPLNETYDYYSKESLPRLKSQLPESSFLETIAGGKWAAVRYLQVINQQEQLNNLIESIKKESPDFDVNSLHKVLALDFDNCLQWETKSVDSVIGLIGKIRVDLSKEASANQDSKLHQISRKFDLQLAKEIGAGFFALSDKVYKLHELTADQIAIALVSTVFEAHYDDDEWLGVIRKTSNIDNIFIATTDQTEREAVPHMYL